MSTVSPSNPGTEAELPKALASANGFTFEPSSVPPSAHFSRGQVSDLPLTSEYEADVEVLIPADPMFDTKTFRLDDTALEIPAGNRSPVMEQQIAQVAAVDASGALTLEPPAANGPLDGLAYEAAKRVFDVVVSSLLLILLSPLLLLSALLVKLTDGGSIFYPHIRVGEGGNEFSCYKFRSMVVNADKLKANLSFFNSHSDQRSFKIPDDPRVTRVGRWMRRTSVDELPQLWNVLKGEMSIVGPRPPLVNEVEQYTRDDMQRLAVKPGLTCIWQVSGRSRLPFPEQLKMDIEYIENRGFALDVKLVLLTVPAVISADGAY